MSACARSAMLNCVDPSVEPVVGPKAERYIAEVSNHARERASSVTKSNVKAMKSLRKGNTQSARNME
jgi:hypothetical protein